MLPCVPRSSVAPGSQLGTSRVERVRQRGTGNGDGAAACLDVGQQTPGDAVPAGRDEQRFEQYGQHTETSVAAGRLWKSAVASIARSCQLAAGVAALDRIRASAAAVVDAEVTRTASSVDRPAQRVVGVEPHEARVRRLVVRQVPGGDAAHGQLAAERVDPAASVPTTSSETRRLDHAQRARQAQDAAAPPARTERPRGRPSRTSGDDQQRQLSQQQRLRRPASGQVARQAGARNHSNCRQQQTAVAVPQRRLDGRNADISQSAPSPTTADASCRPRAGS